MTNTGNGQSLLRGGRGEQGAGSAEQDLFQFFLPEFAQKFATKGDGAAAAAGTACMNVLVVIIKYYITAISVTATKVVSLFNH